MQGYVSRAGLGTTRIRSQTRAAIPITGKIRADQPPGFRVQRNAPVFSQTRPYRERKCLNARFIKDSFQYNDGTIPFKITSDSFQNPERYEQYE
jgi:hypothetical protein